MFPELDLDIRYNAAGNQFLHFPFMSISDTHWGTKHSRAKRLTHMLEHTNADRIYAIGDMIDGEYMLGKKKWNFPPWHRQGIAQFCRKAEGGTEVIYILGNHEAGIRQKVTISRHGSGVMHRNMCGKSLYGIKFADQAVYVDPLDRRIKIEHGDQYDYTLGAAPLGDAVLELMYNLDTWFQHLPRCADISIAAKGKRIVKTIIDKGWSFRKNIARLVDDDPLLHGIVTGHSHISEISRTPGGKLRINDGCCTEHVEALVQDRNGTFALLEWHEAYLRITYEGGTTRVATWQQLGLDAFLSPPRLIEDASTERADRLIRLVYRTWPPKERRRPETRDAWNYATGHAIRGSTPAYIPVPNPRRPNPVPRKSTFETSPLESHAAI